MDPHSCPGTNVLTLKSPSLIDTQMSPAEKADFRSYPGQLEGSGTGKRMLPVLNYVFLFTPLRLGYKGRWRRSYVTRGCQCWGVLCGHRGCLGLQLGLTASPMWWSPNGLCGTQFFWGGVPLYDKVLPIPTRERPPCLPLAPSRSHLGIPPCPARLWVPHSQAQGASVILFYVPQRTCGTGKGLPLSFDSQAHIDGPSSLGGICRSLGLPFLSFSRPKLDIPRTLSSLPCSLLHARREEGKGVISCSRSITISNPSREITSLYTRPSHILRSWWLHQDTMLPSGPVRTRRLGPGYWRQTSVLH